MTLSSVNAPLKTSVDLKPSEWENIRVVDHRTLFAEFGETAEFCISLNKVSDFISRYSISCADELEAASLVEYGDSWDQKQASSDMHSLRTKHSLKGILFFGDADFTRQTSVLALQHQCLWKSINVGASERICVDSHLLALKI